MFKKFLAEKNPSTLNKVLFAIVIGIFCVLFYTEPPIWSPDTYSYFSVPVHRFPVYSLFLRSFEFILGRENFDIFIVIAQFIAGFIGIRMVYDRCAHVFSLPPVIRVLLIAILVAPYFPPLCIATNLASEGLAYPLYLLLITFAIDFLFRKQKTKLLYLSVIFILLCLTRGQFIIMAPIIAVIFVVRKRKSVFRKGNLIRLVLLLILPLLTKGIDKSFHKVVHGHFVSTPYSYVNAVTLPLFVAKWEDSSAIENKDYRNLFVQSYKTIDSLGYTRAMTFGDSREQYENFHDHFPMICNQNLHDKGRAYFLAKEGVEHLDGIRTEEASKAILPILIANNSAAYFDVYFEGILNGFKSIFVLGIFILILFYSFWRTLKRYSAHNAFILMGTTFILTNALLVGFACHTIERYLFYNYFIAFLILVLAIRKLIPKL